MKKKPVGVQLRSLNNLITRYMERSPVKQQVDRITGTNGWIIGYIAEHPNEDIYQKNLEQRFGITRSTTSKVLTLMEHKGLIIRQSVPGDARLKKIVLTQRAFDVHEMVKEDAERFEKKLTQGFTEDEMSNLFDYLERMKSNMKRPD